jgi:hypothetical protein
MSSAREHHAKAEQLLGQARGTPDQISRREILAEAQVHATLALSAPAENGPPGPGRSETGTAATREADPGRSDGGGDLDPQPGMPAGQASPEASP